MWHSFFRIILFIDRRAAIKMPTFAFWIEFRCTQNWFSIHFLFWEIDRWLTEVISLPSSFSCTLRTYEMLRVINSNYSFANEPTDGHLVLLRNATLPNHYVYRSISISIETEPIYFAKYLSNHCDDTRDTFGYSPSVNSEHHHCRHLNCIEYEIWILPSAIQFQ